MGQYIDVSENPYTVLEKASCLSAISADARNCLFKNVSFVEHSDKELIFLQGDQARNLYVIVTGYVRISYIYEDGSRAILGILQRGDCLGELGICERNCYVETATAIGDVRLARIGLRAFENCFTDSAMKDRSLAGLLAARYRDYLRFTRALSRTSLAERLASILLDLVRSIGSTITIAGREFACLSPLITQADLGAMARGTRTNVNRTLKEWERAGWILLQDRSIVVLKKSGLESVTSTKDAIQ